MALQLVGIGVELLGQVAQLVGQFGRAFGDPPHFDRGHAHEGNRADYRFTAVCIYRLRQEPAPAVTVPSKKVNFELS